MNSIEGAEPGVKMGFGIRRKSDGYYAECQLPVGEMYAEKGPFPTQEEALAELNTFREAFVASILPISKEVRVVHLTPEQSRALAQRPPRG